MQTPLVAVLAGLGLLTSACVFSIDTRGYRGSAASLERTRAENRDHLQHLALGMSVEQVHELMGSDPVWGGDGVGWIGNPYRSESYPDNDGHQTLLLFYLTEVRHADGRVSDDELTPVAFQNGVLVGWGWTYYHRVVRVA